MQEEKPKDGTEEAGASCPDCGCTELAVISDGPLVTVYKCPRCGKLLAPVKQR